MSAGGVSGQARALKVLAGFLSSNRVPQAILFHGPAGVGKALAAGEFAAALLCEKPPRGGVRGCGACAPCAAFAGGRHPDFIRVDAAYQACLRQEELAKQKSLRIGTVREARRAMETSAILGGRKVAVVEDAEGLEIEAANALLKILEEPPPNAVWILTASRRDRLPKTVLSRCAAVAFAPLDEETVERILAEQGVGSEDAAAAAKDAGGSAGRALELSRRGYPRALISGAASPAEASESLGPDLPSARTQAELALFALRQELWRSWKEGRTPLAEASRALGVVRELGESLRANVDPKAVVLLAC
ncbi:MAG: DNA polymerase III subunit delta', partial [Elusimicrobia bacterium]|nr:DNA polymerase III subunit delta' [Elusimicrobiota bacterium]